MKIRLLFFTHLRSILGLITLPRLNLINCKIFTILHNPYYNLFAYSSCTSLFILLFIKSTYCIAHFTQFFLFNFYYLYLSSCVVLHILYCPLSGPDLTYISLLIIFTNKKTLNLGLLDPVRKTSNKVRASVLKCPSHQGQSLGFFLMGLHRGGKDPVRGAHGKSHVPQHKWDDLKGHSTSARRTSLFL